MESFSFEAPNGFIASATNSRKVIFGEKQGRQLNCQDLSMRAGCRCERDVEASGMSMLTLCSFGLVLLAWLCWPSPVGLAQLGLLC